MAEITLHDDVKESKVSELQSLHAAWKHAKGKWDMESYAPDYVENGLPDDIADAHCDRTADALNAYLLHPTKDPRELARKMRVILDEQIYNNWYKGAEIAARMSADAHRIAFGGQ